MSTNSHWETKEIRSRRPSQALVDPRLSIPFLHLLAACRLAVQDPHTFRFLKTYIILCSRSAERHSVLLIGCNNYLPFTEKSRCVLFVEYNGWKGRTIC